MQDLIEILNLSNPSYIRCIKPNNFKTPNQLDSSEVLRQLKCGGLLEAIRIRKAGYDIRRTHQEFLKRYKVLSPNFSMTNSNSNNNNNNNNL